MDLVGFANSVLSSIVWAFIGVILLIASSWFFDRIHPINFYEEIKRGNSAAAIFFGAVVLGIALIIFAAVR